MTVEGNVHHLYRRLDSIQNNVLVGQHWFQLLECHTITVLVRPC